MDLAEYNRIRGLLVKRFKSLGIAPMQMPETVWAAIVMGNALHIAVRATPDDPFTYIRVTPAPQIPIETLFGVTPNN